MQARGISQQEAGGLAAGNKIRPESFKEEKSF